jgi:hypothetical protein
MEDNKIEEISFDKREIDEALKKNEIFQKDDDNIFSLIDESTQKKKDEKYFVHIKRDKEEYLGILTDNFKKEKFGYSLFSQGDEYLGEISDEKKNGFGIYLFNYSNEKNKNDIYIGNFTDNKIDGKGIYINILESTDKSNEGDSSILLKYNCYIGIFENREFKKGKIYIVVDKETEKLIIENEENRCFIVEKNNNDFYVYDGTVINDKLNKKDIINIKDDKETEVKFLSKDMNSGKKDKVQKQNKMKDIYDKFKNLNFKKYKESTQAIVSKIKKLFNEIKSSFKTAKTLDQKFQSNFNEDFNFLIN